MLLIGENMVYVNMWRKLVMVGAVPHVGAGMSPGHAQSGTDINSVVGHHTILVSATPCIFHGLQMKVEVTPSSPLADYSTTL